MCVHMWVHNWDMSTGSDYGIPTILMVVEETTVVIEGFIKSVLKHVTVLPFIAAVMFTVKMEDRQYEGSDDRMLLAL